MAEIKLYNSYSKQLETFEPQQPGHVSLYHCGPTVYKRQHLGNMRRFLFADFLRRTFELAGYQVKDVTNITDVGHLTQDEIDEGEDKLSREAKVRKTTPQDIAEAESKQFFADLKALNIKPSTAYPRATKHIEQMQKLIQKLLDRGAAYETDTGVYFDVTQFPNYGHLSGNTIAQLEAGKRIEIRKEKKHPADFALWIFDTKALQNWDSPWGAGYPGWHIECSAMSTYYLSSPIDIHTGGEDNKFPHHDNEIAQSESVLNGQFVRYWLHNAHLQIEGRKLAKSDGDSLSLDSLRQQNLSPLAFRLFIFSGHYRSPLQFSWQKVEVAQEHLVSLKQLLRRLLEQGEIMSTDKPHPEVIAEFSAALFDDLNTPTALAVFLSYLSQAHHSLDQQITAPVREEIWSTLFRLDQVLGLVQPLLTELRAETVPTEIEELASKREQARKENDFKQADQIRQQIEQAGYTVEDTAAGPRLKPRDNSA